MKIIAITGSIGCGKTFLSDIIRKLGYVVYDADKWVKYLYYRPEFLDVIKQNFPKVFVSCFLINMYKNIPRQEQRIT